MNLKNQQGFTLIELMVCIVIIGILMLIAVPIYQGVQDTAREVADDLNVRNLNQATTMWELTEGVTVGAYLANNNDESRLLSVLVGEWISEPVDPWGQGRKYSVVVDGAWQVLGRP